MASASESSDPARLVGIKSEVDAVLSSQVFGRSPSLAHFLSYVCQKALAGEASEIKEYSIAVEVFGREAEFDQKEDAIVRVEAHRLRKRLKLYYETEGSDHPIRIAIPPGQYAPQFIDKRTPPPAAALIPPETPELLPPLPDGDLKTDPASLLPPPPSRPNWPRIAALAVGIAVLAVLGFRLARTIPDQRLPAVAASTPLEPPQLLDENVIRIAAGSTEPKRVDSLGDIWLGDRYFTGGGAGISENQPVMRTRDAFLYQHRREGDFRYDIPLKPGAYELHLHFSEPVFGSGNLAGGGETSRLFHVLLNEEPLLSSFDTVCDANGANTADIKVFKDISPAPDGYLHLRFTPQKDSAMVSGIVVLPGMPGRMHPVRIAAGDANATDHAGNVWRADRFFSGGQTVVRPKSVTATADPELYRSERFGNFNYAVPVAPGRYTVNLRFAEAWFGSGKPAGGGAGSRLFAVHCNGAVLLKSLDVYKTAGGSNVAVERSFHGLTPNPQGKLLLSFIPIRNYAFVNAIEVIAETN